MPPPQQTLDSLFRALQKGSLAPVYYLYGPEDILKEEAIAAILDRALDPSLRDFNLDQRSAGQLDPEAVIALCTTLPMLAGRRVVVLREVEGWKRRPRTRGAFLSYLEHPVPETVVILVQGAGEVVEDKELARGSFTVRCDPLPLDRALRWLQRRTASLKLTLEESAARHLIHAVGGDLNAVAAELEKLAALGSGTPLTIEQVAAVLGIHHGETVYDWRDAVMDDEPSRATALISLVLDQPGSSGVKLVTLLGTTLVGVALTRSWYDRQVRGSALEKRMFETLLRLRVYGLMSYSEESARWVKWAGRWPAQRLRAALRAARDADLALKGITISGEHAVLSTLVLRLAMPQVEAA
jgi:DNA polymerase III subunit delta